jgi:SpoVK/Ycf46/Vps4 family AAA+-type ATPase
LRPGRFDRTVVVDRPDVSGREAILKVHSHDVKMSKDVDLRHVASLTPGCVGADLANLVNEAALLAARDAADASRPVAPLRMANDAVPLDGTDLSFEQQVAEIVRLARREQPAVGGNSGR